MVYQVLVLADDMTGALEVGAKFAATGLSALVTTRCSIPADTDQEAVVLVIDTETRHSAPELARRRVLELSRAGFDRGIPYVYKKTDSTLRGNITSEIAAVMEGYPDLPLLYMPAYPAMNRTVREGTLRVNGVPVNETGFAEDPLNAVRTANIPRLFSSAGLQPVVLTTPVELKTSLPAAVYVCDATSESDLEVAARKFVQSNRFRLAAGPAGFVGHLAPLFDLPRTAPPGMPAVRRALLVNGSSNAVSGRQISYAHGHGFSSIMANGAATEAEELDWVILDHDFGKCDPSDYASRLSQSVCGALRREEFDAVVVFGGDTVFAIVEALGHPDLHPIGEVMEGVPISAVCRKSAGLKGEGPFYLVSKAGGFGPVDVLSLIHTNLTQG
jgi:D-threonate/D-erythronate kinase